MERKDVLAYQAALKTPAKDRSPEQIELIARLGDPATGHSSPGAADTLAGLVAGDPRLADVYSAYRHRVELIPMNMARAAARRASLGGDRSVNESVWRANEALANERAGSRAREEAMVEMLSGILEEMRRLTTRVEQHEEELIRIRSGAAGRPSSIHLVIAELRRRGEAGELEPTLIGQAKVLSKWVAVAHSLAAPAAPTTIKNNPEFRRIYREFKPRQQRSG